MNEASARAKPTRPPSASSLRAIGVLDLLARAPLRLRLRLVLRGGAKTALEVVEDETDRRLGRRRRGDQAAVAAYNEDAALGGRNLGLVRRGRAVGRRGCVQQPARRADERARPLPVGEG